MATLSIAWSVATPVLACTPTADGELTECQQVPAAESVLLLIPRINEQVLHRCAYVLMIEGHAYVSETDLNAWHLRQPPVAPRRYRNADYYALDAIEGLSYRIDDCQQELLINGDPAIFRHTIIEGIKTASDPPAPASPGGFFNYDVQWDDRYFNGLFEVGAFGGQGVGTSSFVRNHDTAQQAQWLRLDTTWTRDWPERRQSLRLGDAITRAGTLGRPVRFGGVKWGTNFATQPGFITYPMPALHGEAALPSTVDVYVNNVLRLHRDLPPGPFEIPAMPVVTGSGEVSLVVRDMLGRETQISQPYYASQALLREGLHDFSFELGAVREDYGLRSARYGDGIGVATYRSGLSDTFTGELRAELSARQQAAGAMGRVLWPAWGTFEAGTMLSRSDTRDDGAQLVLGTERRSRSFSLALRTQLASTDFIQLGMPTDRPAPRQITSAHVGWPLGRGSVSLSYVRQDWRDQDDISVASASYSMRLGRLHLSFSAIQTRSTSESNIIGLTATLPLGTRSSASVHHSRQDGRGRTIWQAQRNLPAGEGVGFRALAEKGDSDRVEAGLAWQTRIGTYTFDAARSQGETRQRLGISGGVAVLDGSAFLTQPVTDSFAVVRVGEYSDVRVTAENQIIGHTDQNGRLLVPRLRAYQPNLLGIEQADLPIDAEVQILQQRVAPYHRSGVLVDFPVQDSGGALLTIQLEDGTPLPAGAEVTMFGREQAIFPVGWQGQVFVTNLSDSNRIEARWHGQSCRIEFNVPPEAGPLPAIGPLICKGVQP